MTHTDAPIQKLYYSIREVSEELNVSYPTLRFWEVEFNLEIKKPGKDRFTMKRLYTRENVSQLRYIKALLQTRTVKEAMPFLKEDLRYIGHPLWIE